MKRECDERQKVHRDDRRSFSILPTTISGRESRPMDFLLLLLLFSVFCTAFFDFSILRVSREKFRETTTDDDAPLLPPSSSSLAFWRQQKKSTKKQE